MDSLLVTAALNEEWEEILERGFAPLLPTLPGDRLLNNLIKRGVDEGELKRAEFSLI